MTTLSDIQPGSEAERQQSQCTSADAQVSAARARLNGARACITP